VTSISSIPIGSNFICFFFPLPPVQGQFVGADPWCRSDIISSWVRCGARVSLGGHCIFRDGPLSASRGGTDVDGDVREYRLSTDLHRISLQYEDGRGRRRTEVQSTAALLRTVRRARSWRVRILQVMDVAVAPFSSWTASCSSPALLESRTPPPADAAHILPPPLLLGPAIPKHHHGSEVQ
jgi:hypothetical protein